VIVVADKESYTGTVVEVIDQCRLAGAKGVSIAAKREE
jgi:biopolymer transport protein ExbD